MNSHGNNSRIRGFLSNLYQHYYVGRNEGQNHGPELFPDQSIPQQTERPRRESQVSVNADDFEFYVKRVQMFLNSKSISSLDGEYTDENNCVESYVS